MVKHLTKTMYTENIMSPAHSVTQRLGLGCWLGHEFCVRTLSQRKGLIVFSGMFFFSDFSVFFTFFPLPFLLLLLLGVLYKH